jgi:putative CocE/NonD family hydrolase
MTTGKRTTSLVVLLVALTCSMLAVHSRSTRAQTGEPYEIVATHNVMVAVRDGVRLATDVYSPGRGGITTGRFPTIVERTPYNKDSIAADSTGYFVPRGYVVVLQDVRGRYRSEGTWRPIRDDRPDGAELLKWITEQPWSNGKVGTVGTSYAGATQHAIAITNAPALTAMVPVDSMSNYGRFGIRHNRVHALLKTSAAIQNTGCARTRCHCPRARTSSYFRRLRSRATSRSRADWS